MFIDEKELLALAGDGGSGAVLFRREKYVPRGGPDGGDGGHGGDVIVIGQPNLHTLLHLAHIDRVHAEAGMKGGHKRSSGKSGESTTIPVPLGTVVTTFPVEGAFRTAESSEPVGVTEAGQEVLVARGGKGGWGNWHFRSSTNQAPRQHHGGQPGDQVRVRLVLKLIADVGLVGLPNSGKSTLLSVISAAKPKIADYPFTTLEPQLGVASVDDRSIVVADLPGLIEGASRGRGLGTAFLKHVERTRILVHCLDGSAGAEQLVVNYRTVRHEIESWSAVLAAKPEILLVTKADLIPEVDRPSLANALVAQIGVPDVVIASAVSGEGVRDFLRTLARKVLA